MLLIRCPNCGARAEWEFAFGGPSHVDRPGPPQAADDRQWADYLFYRDNPKGRHRERWCHSYGCGVWFNLERDTVTHAITEVYRMGAQPGARLMRGEHDSMRHRAAMRAARSD